MINKPIEATWDKFDKVKNQIIEPKLDGIRGQLGRGTLFHDTSNKTIQFPEIVRHTKFIPEDTIFDGEITILENKYKANFWNLLQRQTTTPLKIKLLAEKIPATFMIFDVLKWKGENMTKKNIEERQKIISDWIIKTYSENKSVLNNINVVESMNHESNILEVVKKFNMEGVVVKRPESNYLSEWKKFKYYLENDFKIVGINSKTKLISSLQLENLKGEDMGSVNYQGKQSQEIYDSLVGKVAVVRHMLTNKNKVRFPVLKEIRN